jgi:parallel beta-helix repeat protein
MSRRGINRRDFLLEAGLVTAAALQPVGAATMPGGEHQRATDGDDRFEPNWEERFILTVGNKAGDLIGKDDRVLQAAVDYVARMGGGTVRLLPGTYTLRNAVFLPSKLRLLGSGTDTIITRGPSERVRIADDSNWFDQEITLEKVGDFRVGDGVVIQAKNPHNSGSTVIKRTLVARSGNRFKLDRGLRENVWISGEPTCASLFPLLTSEHTHDVWIENLTLDGNRRNCENFNGNYGGCIFLQDCNRYTFRNVIAREYNGDGISFQICHDVVVEGCRCENNTDLGIHAGSGSQRPVIRENRLEGNGIGLFWCWGVKFGLAENNRIDRSPNYGISIGHCDTDNIMRGNEVRNSGKVGLLFRDENRGRDFWANRNLVERNRIVNSGDANGIAIDIQGNTKDVRLSQNTLQETRAPMSRIGVRVAAKVERLNLEGNRIEGFAVPIADLRG